MAFLDKDERARREFLKAVKAGKVDEGALKRGLITYEFDVDEVVWCLFERDSTLRKFGLLAIGRSGQRDKMSQLFGLLVKETSYPRRTALVTTITRCRDDATFSELGKLVNSPDLELRRTAQTLLVRLDGWARQRDLVVTLLEDPDPVIACKMVESLIDDASSQYRGYLRHMAIHDSVEVREAVLRWLIKQGDAENADIFFSRLPHETGHIREALLDALGDLAKDSPEEMTDRVVLFLGDPADDVRTMAMELYVRLPNQKEAFIKLMTYASSTADWIRESMFEEARKFADTFVDPLLAFIEDPRFEPYHHHAYKFAYVLGHKRLIPIFKKDWDKGDWLHRYQVLQIISQGESEEAIPFLVRALDENETCLVAVQGLLKFKNPKIVSNLVGRLPSLHPAAQIEILVELQAYKDPKITEFLGTFVRRPELEDDVRKQAAESLKVLCELLELPYPKDLNEFVKHSKRTGVHTLKDLDLRLEPD